MMMSRLTVKYFWMFCRWRSASFSTEQNRQLFEAVSEDYADIRNKRNRWQKIKENPYFNALQVKYAYALTCHKAQGGQWKAVFVDHGYLVEEMLEPRLLPLAVYSIYTAGRKALS
jgi:exodeoxyribonuclease V